MDNVYFLQATCLISFSIFLVFLGIALRFTSPNTMERMLKQYSAGPRSLEQIEMSRPFGERVVLPLLRGLARLVSRFTPESNIESIKHRLDVAGSPNGWTVVDFLGVRVLAAVSVAILAILYVYFLKAPVATSLLLIAGATGLAYYLPMLWLTFKARARQSGIEKALPDALDLLSVCVEAGLGLDSAIQKVTQKWDNDLAREFSRVLSEVRVGKLRREALRDMAARCDVADLSNFTAAVIQAEQLGVAITKVMRIQSEQMRLKRRQRAEEKAQQAPIKMLVPLAFLIFPSIFIVILGPTVIRLLTRGLF